MRLLHKNDSIKEEEKVFTGRKIYVKVYLNTPFCHPFENGLPLKTMLIVKMSLEKLRVGEFLHLNHTFYQECVTLPLPLIEI